MDSEPRHLHARAGDAGGRPLPALQFTERGALKTDLSVHIKELQETGLGPWQTWTWLVMPATLLSGEVPSEFLIATLGGFVTP
jgi:hypothetical protein